MNKIVFYSKDKNGIDIEKDYIKLKDINGN